MNEVVPFSFDDTQVRVVMVDAEPWFVAKDVASVLGYADPRKAIRDHCKGVDETSTPSAGGPQRVKIIPERDVYRLIMRSKLPAAERFEEWVVGEVLPAIRKTGAFTAGVVSSKGSPIFPSIEADFGALHRIARTIFGFDSNQAALRANKVIRQFHGVDVMACLDVTHLLAPQQEDHLTPTDIGLRLGNMSAIAVNALLQERGFQTDWRDDKNRRHWEPTEKGTPYAVWLDTGKRHSDGTPVRQLRWSASILEGLQQEDAELA